MGKELFNPHLRKFSIRKLNVVFVLYSCLPLVLLGVTSQVSADETSALVSKMRFLERILLNHQQLLQHQQTLETSPKPATISLVASAH